METIMYDNSNLSIDSKNLEKYLKYMYDLILKPSQYISEKRKKFEFRNCKNHLYQIMDQFSDALKGKRNLLYDEYFYFIEIYDMIKYTLDRDFSKITVNDIDFISKIFNDFLEFLDYKLTLIENNLDDEDFESKVESYLTKLDESKEFYYNHICEEDMDDDIFIEHCNIIME